jgi:hypothetical protein
MKKSSITEIDNKFLEATKVIRDYLYKCECRNYEESYLDREYKEGDKIDKNHIFYYVRMLDSTLKQIGYK